MKYEVTKDEHGFVHLKLGLNHGVHFEPTATLEDICAGVEELIQTVVGVSAFELVASVLKEWDSETIAVSNPLAD